MCKGSRNGEVEKETCLWEKLISSKMISPISMNEAFMFKSLLIKILLSKNFTKWFANHFSFRRKQAATPQQRTNQNLPFLLLEVFRSLPNPSSEDLPSSVCVQQLFLDRRWCCMKWKQYFFSTAACVHQHY